MRQEAVKEWILIVYSGYVCRLRKAGPGLSAEYEPQTEMLPSGRLVPEIDARNLGGGPQLGIFMSAPPVAIISCKYCRQISGLGTPWQTKSTVNRFSYSFAKKSFKPLI